MPTATPLKQCDIDSAIDWLQNEYFPNGCAIKRPLADVSDGMGGQVDPTYTTITGPNNQPIPCLDEAATRKEQESVKHITSAAVRSIKFPGGQDVRLKDQIIIGTPARTLEVIQVTTLENYELVRPALAMEVV